MPRAGRRVTGSSHLTSAMPGTVAATRPRRDAIAWAGATPVEQHSPGLLADQKMLLLVGDGPYSFFKGEPKTPRLDLSLSPRPALAAATERVRRLMKVALPDTVRSSTTTTTTTTNSKHSWLKPGNDPRFAVAEVREALGFFKTYLTGLKLIEMHLNKLVLN